MFARNVFIYKISLQSENSFLVRRFFLQRCIGLIKNEQNDAIQATNELHDRHRLSGATTHEDQGLLCQSQYTWPLGAEVHEQMPRSGGQSEARPQCLSPQASLVLIYRLTSVGMKGRVDLAQLGNRTQTCGEETRHASTRPPGH
ncbi:uncharacterized protein TNCV_362531 [Trichonephila clavipes]|nr:uncharacterized protein TNCV_362531 [Trichonephila clavipes]